MKFYLKNFKIYIIFFLSIIVGYCFKMNMYDDFIQSYIYKISSNGSIYLILVLALICNEFAYQHLKKSIVFFRKKYFLKYYLTFIEFEIIDIVGILFFIHFPVLVFYPLHFFNNIYPIFLCFINILFIILLISSFVKLLDIWIKNRIFSSVIIFIIFGLLHIFSENIFTWSVIEFNNIFIFPVVYNYFLCFFCFLFFLTMVLNFLFSFLAIKKDYFLGRGNNEEI